MELDLRKPGLSSKLNMPDNFGFTNYIISGNVNFKDIVKPLEIHPNLYLISSGPIPPNPAETLMSPRTTELMKELKNKFDYIIIDAPPIGIVTDAQLIAPFSDMCLYLVRQNFTTKDQLNIVENLGQSKKMSTLGIVVNGIESSSGYGYGYGYGSYTYGDYDSESKFKKWWRFGS